MQLPRGAQADNAYCAHLLDQSGWKAWRVVSGEGGVQPQNDSRIVAVEWALIVHPAVVEAVAQGGALAEGAPLRVYVVLQSGAAADDAQRAALTAHVAQAMDGDAPPLEFVFVEGLPKTRTGKVARWMLGQDDGV